MCIEAVKRDGGLVGGKALGFHLAASASVYRVREAGPKSLHAEVLRTATDLLIWSKGDANLAVRHLRPRHELGCRRDDLRNASLVVRSKQCRTRRRDDIVAEQFGKRR